MFIPQTLGSILFPYTTLFRSPIKCASPARRGWVEPVRRRATPDVADGFDPPPRSEEHTSELQSRGHLVCRLVLEIKKYLSTLRSEYNHIFTTAYLVAQCASFL